ncbi:hypothetical protein B9G49_13415 [Halorubrum sp. SD683]|nr:hypothetical protein B9G49_13415 [Halorubrum sp. SD683]
MLFGAVLLDQTMAATDRTPDPRIDEEVLVTSTRCRTAHRQDPDFGDPRPACNVSEFKDDFSHKRPAQVPTFNPCLSCFPELRGEDG